MIRLLAFSLTAALEGSGSLAPPIRAAPGLRFRTAAAVGCDDPLSCCSSADRKRRTPEIEGVGSQILFGNGTPPGSTRERRKREVSRVPEVDPEKPCRFSRTGATSGTVFAWMLGYARVSTVKQDLDRQIEALAETGIARDRIYVDKKSARRSIAPGCELCSSTRARAMWSSCTRSTVSVGRYATR